MAGARPAGDERNARCAARRRPAEARSVSARALQDVWAAAIRPAPVKLVAAAVAWYADETTGHAWPSVAALADRCSMGRTQTKAALKRLQAIGVLRVVKRSEGGRRGATTTYEFDPSKLAELGAERAANERRARSADRPGRPADPVGGPTATRSAGRPLPGRPADHNIQGKGLQALSLTDADAPLTRDTPAIGGRIPRRSAAASSSGDACATHKPKSGNPALDQRGIGEARPAQGGKADAGPRWPPQATWPGINRKLAKLGLPSMEKAQAAGWSMGRVVDEMKAVLAERGEAKAVRTHRRRDGGAS
jgi:hypothetical protein